MAIKDLFGKIGKLDLGPSTKRKPQHIALTIDGSFIYSSKNKIDINEVFERNFLNIKNIIKVGVSNNIPILTFYLLPEYLSSQENYTKLVDSISSMLIKMNEWDFLIKNQIKITVFGKWYDLPERLVNPIKDLLDHTRDFDNFFINFCINYNGQEEIVDACKILIKQAVSGKINPESITKESIKENIYTSYFIPPDLIIKTGKVKKTKGLMLWDSIDSKYYFAEKYWPEFSKQDFLQALNSY